MPGAAGRVRSLEGEMAAIVIRQDARAARLPGMAGMRARACDLGRRAAGYAAAAVLTFAAAVLTFAAAAALLQLAVQVAGFPRRSRQPRSR
jgi:hypothetical protein